MKKANKVPPAFSLTIESDMTTVGHSSYVAPIPPTIADVRSKLTCILCQAVRIGA